MPSPHDNHSLEFGNLNPGRQIVCSWSHLLQVTPLDWYWSQLLHSSPHVGYPKCCLGIQVQESRPALTLKSAINYLFPKDLSHFILTSTLSGLSQVTFWELLFKGLLNWAVHTGERLMQGYEHASVPQLCYLGPYYHPSLLKSKGAVSRVAIWKIGKRLKSLTLVFDCSEKIHININK